MARTAIGASLHIGVNVVSGANYEGWTGPLAACEFDANDMAAVAKAQGIVPKVLLTRKATRANVLKGLRAASKRLKSGDLFLLTYSGHGGQVDDISGEEDDKLDETWCLYDSQLIDDELYLELSRFAKGVRVLVLSDSCHSGTVTRAALPASGATGRRPRLMPPVVARQVYAAHQALYDRRQRAVAAAAGNVRVVDPDSALANVTVSGRLTRISARCKASVVLISGCQDNQSSMDGDKNGAFTQQVLAVWDNGSYVGSQAVFHAQVKSRLPRSQSPNLFPLGPSARFMKQRPFTI